MSRQSQSQSSLNAICPSWPQPLLTHLAPRLLITSVALPWLYVLPVRWHPDCTQCCRWGHAAQSRGDNPLLGPLAVLGLLPPRYNWSFWLQGTLLAPIQLSIRQNPQTSFHRDALQPLVPQFYTEAGLLNLSKVELPYTQPLHKSPFTAQSEGKKEPAAQDRAREQGKISLWHCNINYSIPLN